MIDPQPVEHALVHPLEHAEMCVLKDLFIFNPQADERVDIEEPPVSQIAIGAAPPGEPVVLHFEQRVQRIGVAVHVGDDLIDGRRRERVFVEQPSQLLAEHGLVAMPPSHARAIGCRGTRQSTEGIGEKGERV